ncbi:uncharacterized protein LOC119111606 [Pollicipes pollicipes]|uniref:uncharacterized protein LOC119111606 n=1 Tax=Pollicipes pollicipes TaxID=41117 RepID=UPI0018853F15|nr:uncharacterized protein LOC119111606 [Pollicipes pollicipes]
MTRSQLRTVPMMLALLLSVVSGRTFLVKGSESSDGCGQNPLVTLLNAAQQFQGLSMSQLMSALEHDRDAFGELLGLIQAYHDCVRTGDGIRYKRTRSNTRSSILSLLRPRASERSPLKQDC